MITKPTSKINWTAGNLVVPPVSVEPTATKKQAGWGSGEQPPAEFMNWLFQNLQEWQDYFEQVTDQLQIGFDAVIGDTGNDSAATHSSIQAAVDDTNLGSNLVIFIKQSLPINTIINLNKSGWRLIFAPGVVYTKNGVTSCFSIAADGISINYGRFVGWTAGGDSVFNFTSSGEYGVINQARFGSGTNTEVDDSAVPAGRKPAVTGTITEQ